MNLRSVKIFGLSSENAPAGACENLHKRLFSRGMEDGKPPQQSSSRRLSGGDFAGLGIQFAAAIVLFVFIGQWLDRRFGDTGMFTIAGVFVGAAGAFYNMYRKVSAAQKEDDEERRRRVSR
jgi:F0F1-type ATP synthase assembly protein I